jgi:hypothetical protein
LRQLTYGDVGTQLSSLLVLHDTDFTVGKKSSGAGGDQSQGPNNGHKFIKRVFFFVLGGVWGAGLGPEKWGANTVFAYIWVAVVGWILIAFQRAFSILSFTDSAPAP